MKSTVYILAAAVACAATPALAQSGPEVLKAKGCLNCHAFDQRKIGPAFKEVAAKHAGNKNAEAELVAKIKAGTAHPKIAASDAELKAAVQQVLSTK